MDLLLDSSVFVKWFDTRDEDEVPAARALRPPMEAGAWVCTFSILHSTNSAMCCCGGEGGAARVELLRCFLGGSSGTGVSR